MSETIESFVSRLHQEGLEAGKREAERITREAADQAARQLREAHQEARRIIEQAQRRRAEIREQTDAELHLAARDAVLKLTDTLSAAVRAAVEHDAGHVLHDPAWLASVLKAVIRNYVKKDAAGEADLEITLPPDVVDDVRSELLGTLSENEDGLRLPSAALLGALNEAGFEYRTRGYLVQVTPQSVAAMLAEMITEDLAVIVKDAVQESAFENGEAYEPYSPLTDAGS